METFKSLKLPFIAVVTALILISCSEPKSPEEVGINDPQLLRDSMHKLSMVMVHDIFSPPVASRVYGYASIAAYEAIALNDPEYRSLAGQLHEFSEGPKASEKELSLELASLHAFLKVGEALVFSTEEMAAYRDSIYTDMKKRGVSRTIFENSIEYGEQVGEHVLNWAEGDRYKETRGTQKYTVTDEPGRWIPTPPAYMDAIEPSWHTLRTFVIESSDQFKPVPPVPFDMREGSDFYNQVMEVYQIGQNLTPEEEEIAKFWDCNPYATQVKGHFMFAVKKITPGGHWMGIAGIASEKADADFAKTAETYALTSIALYDAFISSWDEKFRSNLIRPETVINQHIDPDWKPLLQTPPFPEYTSGHSTISRAAAEALTSIYGPDFEFDDTTEVEFGLPVRSFNSFIEASEEAAISRLYGGIHYRMAAEHGITQGRDLGQYIVKHVALSASSPIAEVQ